MSEYSRSLVFAHLPIAVAIDLKMTDQQGLQWLIEEPGFFEVTGDFDDADFEDSSDSSEDYGTVSHGGSYCTTTCNLQASSSPLQDFEMPSDVITFPHNPTD